jgi:hypothetical protein
MGDAIDTGGTDIAFIEPAPAESAEAPSSPAYSPPPPAPVFTPGPTITGGNGK